MGSPFVQIFAPTLGMTLLVSAIVIDSLLAFSVYRNNPKSSTNKMFVLLSIFIIFWSATYIAYFPKFAADTLLLTRLGIFFAAPMSALFFLFAHTFPEERFQLKREAVSTIIAATLFMMVVNISPYAFTEAEIVNGTIAIKTGLGFIPFAVLSTLFSVLAIYYLVQKFRHAQGERREQLRLVLAGISLMLFFIISTILVPIIVFKSGFFVSFIPIYILVFLGMTAYAIVRYHLFNLRVVAAQALVVVIWTVLFARIFAAESAQERLIETLILGAMVVFGVLLVRSVMKEVEQRQRLEVLTKELAAANEKLKELDRLKSEFISLASHQLRSPLAVIRGYLSMILEGSYGEMSAEVKKSLGNVLASAEQLIRLVTDLMNLSRIESGKLTYNFGSVAFADVVEKVLGLFRESAEEKWTAIRYDSTLASSLAVRADFEKLYEVVMNLIDNAVKYSPTGEVVVRLEEVQRDRKSYARLSVRDEGIGIAAEDIPRLFNKFTRTEAAKNVRADGMGIGLYFARRVVEDHGGRIWAESPGLEQGSTFFVELPVQKS
ncbi:hypothetical protein HYW67_03870 [Candidatus Parcubacteria bacterium]|nr:hypothetical protein [Candidatus Parcubacteria bacterium]